MPIARILLFLGAASSQPRGLLQRCRHRTRPRRHGDTWRRERWPIADEGIAARRARSMDDGLAIVAWDSSAGSATNLPFLVGYWALARQEVGHANPQACRRFAVQHARG